MRAKEKMIQHSNNTTMKQIKQISLLCLLWLVVMCASAEVVGDDYEKNGDNVKWSFETEFDLGITLPLDKYHGGEQLVGPSLAVNLRYNIKDTPWDCGLLLQTDGARRDFWHDKNSDNWQTNRTMILAANGGYNFRQGEKVNPFISTALGVGFNQVVGDTFIDINSVSPVIMPKIGVELWHMLRINSHVMVTQGI